MGVEQANMKRFFATSLAILLLWTRLGHAQDWPNKPIKLIVPFPAGGPTDMVGREAANILRDEFKQPVVVENRPGGNGVTGHGVLAKAAPDGYTIGLMVITVAIAPHVGEVPFDTFKDFTPITNFVSMTPILIANKDTPFNHLSEVVRAAKSQPAKYAYGTPGLATVPHLAAELLQQQAGISFLHVPYKGATQQIQDLIGGSTQLDFQSSLVVALPQIKAGKVKPIAVFSAKRSAQLPDVPTVAESGYPQLVVQPWFGIGAPAGVPPAIVQKLHATLVKGMNQPEVLERFASIGATVQPSVTPTDFGNFIRKEHERWGKVIRDANIRTE